MCPCELWVIYRIAFKNWMDKELNYGQYLNSSVAISAVVTGAKKISWLRAESHYISFVQISVWQMVINIVKRHPKVIDW